jgi:hypothetical protein
VSDISTSADIRIHVKLASEVRIGCSFECSESITDDKSCCAEASKRTVDKTRPGEQSTDAIEEKPPDEGSLVTPMPQYPVGVTE